MLNIVRRRPGAVLRDTGDLFGGLFEDFFTPFLFTVEDGGLRVPLDVVEKKDHIEVRAELPGLEEKDLEVSVHDGYLTLKGEKKEETEEKEADFHRVERRYGAFARTIALPEYVNADDVSAEYKKGVLKIRLGKKEEVKPRQIPVKAEK